MANRTLTGGPIPVFSNQGTTDEVFHDMTGWLPCNQCKSVRMTVEMRSMTTAIKIKRAYQLCNAQDDPDTATAFGNYLTLAGFSYPSASGEDISSSWKQYVRFGVMATQSTGTNLEMARVAISAELRQD